MKTVHAKRLLKLMNHLLHGKLGHKTFDFSIYNNGNNNICGTNGCAVGECPIVFPRQWCFDYGDPTLRGNTCTIDSTEHFFGLNRDERRHLFVPDCQEPEAYGGRHLGPKATRRQVAANIRAFLKKFAPSVLKAAKAAV